MKKRQRNADVPQRKSNLKILEDTTNKSYILSL